MGVALLGTVINAGYRGAAPTVHDTAVQARIDDSVSSGMAVARAVGSPDLVHAVQSAFVHGMSLMLLVGAKDYQLRQWTVTDPQGFDTTVAVYNLDTTKKPDPDMFTIVYPDRPDPR